MNGEEKWGAQQVGCRGSDLQGRRTVPQAGRRSVESLNGIIKKSLRGHGMFTLPGLLKMKVVKKPPRRRVKASIPSPKKR